MLIQVRTFKILYRIEKLVKIEKFTKNQKVSESMTKLFIDEDTHMPC